MAYRALITGASSGLGAEFARQLAALNVNLVLVARDGDRLERLAHVLRSRFDIETEVLQADLTQEADLELVAARLAAQDATVDILINNAGFGVHAGFEASEIADERRMHELLSWVPLRLAHAAVPAMLVRGSGWIMNVASVAAFVPSGTYGAAKSSAVSLSRSLNVRYRSRGVRVTALCPGLLATEFHERMGEDHLPAALPSIVWADTARVAREGLRALYRGRSVLVSDWRYRVLTPLISVIPNRVLERLTASESSR